MVLKDLWSSNRAREGKGVLGLAGTKDANKWGKRGFHNRFFFDQSRQLIITSKRSSHEGGGEGSSARGNPEGTDGHAEKRTGMLDNNRCACKRVPIGEEKMPEKKLLDLIKQRRVGRGKRG